MGYVGFYRLQVNQKFYRQWVFTGGWCGQALSSHSACRLLGETGSSEVAEIYTARSHRTDGYG